MPRKKISRLLYRTARQTNDIETLASGDPKKITRRIKNKILGRLIPWRFLWK